MNTIVNNYKIIVDIGTPGMLVRFVWFGKFFHQPVGLLEPSTTRRVVYYCLVIVKLVWGLEFMDW